MLCLLHFHLVPLGFVQDSLEDELSTCNESLATEPSFIDENLVFNESKRVPFFKVSSFYSFIKLLKVEKYLLDQDL